MPKAIPFKGVFYKIFFTSIFTNEIKFKVLLIYRKEESEWVLPDSGYKGIIIYTPVFLNGPISVSLVLLTTW